MSGGESKGSKMNESDRAGLWVMAYLYVALFATWFTIICIVGFHIKEWFL